MFRNKVNLKFHMINNEIIEVKNAFRKLLIEEIKDDRSNEIILPDLIILKNKIAYIDIEDIEDKEEIEEI